ncbi:MAG: hypothetical protein JXL97_00540 [Bacteroidales bacterium]|nr:hypothetical protein [Bacteroidales bacterium]
MKKIAFLLVIAFFFVGVVNSQVVEIKKMPTTIDEFLEMRDNIANTPEGGATMFIIALKIYQENPELGAQCLVISADRTRLQSGSVYKGFQLMPNDFSRIKSQLSQYPYVVNSYFKGATPENGYTFNFPTQMDFSSNDYSGSVEEGDFKVFVQCYGADNPRPIRLIRNDKGYWKAKEWSSIIMGIRKPVEEIDDDL